MTYTNGLVAWELPLTSLSIAVRKEATGARLHRSEREVNLLLTVDQLSIGQAGRERTEKFLEALLGVTLTALG